MYALMVDQRFAQSAFVLIGRLLNFEKWHSIKSFVKRTGKSINAGDLFRGKIEIPVVFSTLEPDDTQEAVAAVDVMTKDKWYYRHDFASLDISRDGFPH